MKRILAFLFAMSMIATVFSQTEKFDIASFIPPRNWQRIDSNGIVCFLNEKTINGLTSFCQLFLYPSRAGSDNASKNFNEEWNAKVTKTTGSEAKPVTQTEKTPEGWTVVTGSANITQQSITYTCMLIVASGFGKVMTSMVNLAGQDYVQDVTSFFDNLDLNKNANAAVNNNNSEKNQLSQLSDYSYISPEGWQSHKGNNAVVLSQYQTLEYGCLVTIYPPQTSSGNLETDAKNIFSQMYPGWQYRNTGENHDHLSKGYTPQGLEYCMMEADMKRMRPDGYYYDYEDGAVWIINLGKQIAVVTGQHNRNMACFCNQKYEYWRRFFNSFTIKNAAITKNNDEDISRRITGDWMSIGGSALNEYIFAANGNYQYIGAYATTTKTTDAYYEYTHIKTSSFKGDGSYGIKGNQLTFTKHGSKDIEQVQFRFEKVNHSGIGWKDRLYILNRDVGGQYEVCYEKRDK